VKPGFSYRHLYYFWVVAKEGGMSRGAARLDMAVQTVSAQVHELERALGHALLKPAGRALTLTDAGRVVMRQADQIFELGEQLPALLRDSLGTQAVRLTVGISDGLPKLVVRHLMEPILGEPNLRLVAHDDEFDDLLADLALHRIDVVLADRPAPSNPNLKLYSHPLETTPVAWFAPPGLVAAAKRGFPASLANVPVLLPTGHTAVRGRLDRWFERHDVRPKVVGEFEDSALLKTFGAGGMGVFPAAESVADAIATDYGVQRIGVATGVEEHFYAIAAERKVVHPLVRRMLGRRT
jgi:LysR family transcriptional activator of nhaA